MTDLRVEKNIHSSQNLEKLLYKIISSPHEFINSDKLRASLVSQGALSKFDAAEYGITASSLNTLKRISDKHLRSKFLGLDKLRKEALEGINNCSNSDNLTSNKVRKNFEAKYHETKNLLLIARQDLWLMTMALEKSLRRAQHYAERSENNKIIELCAKEQKEIRDMFSLRSKHSQKED